MLEDFLEFNGSLHNPNVSSSSSSLLFYIHCLKSKPICFVYTAFNTLRVFFLLPLCIFILRHGFQNWKQKRFDSRAITHSDCFTYHVVLMELIDIVACILSFTGIYGYYSTTINIGILVLFFVQNGEICFHILTCVERYLAVVHPLTFLRLKNKTGIRIRTMVTSCVWLLCFVGVGLVFNNTSAIIFNFCMLLISLMAVSFCSVAVLCVLIRPGPGEQGENMERIVPLKMRAFVTILAVLVALLLRVVWDLIWLDIFFRSETSDCIILVFNSLFVIPSRLVLPLLYLHRAGNQVCCKQPGSVKK